MPVEQLSVQYVDGDKKCMALMDFLMEDLNLVMTPRCENKHGLLFIFKSHVGRVEASGLSDIPQKYGTTDVIVVLVSRASGYHSTCVRHNPRWNEEERNGLIYLCCSIKDDKARLEKCRGNEMNYPRMKSICEEYRKKETSQTEMKESHSPESVIKLQAKLHQQENVVRKLIEQLQCSQDREKELQATLREKETTEEELKNVRKQLQSSLDREHNLQAQKETLKEELKGAREELQSSRDKEHTLQAQKETTEEELKNVRKQLQSSLDREHNLQAQKDKDSLEYEQHIQQLQQEINRLHGRQIPSNNGNNGELSVQDAVAWNTIQPRDKCGSKGKRRSPNEDSQPQVHKSSKRKLTPKDNINYQPLPGGQTELREEHGTKRVAGEKGNQEASELLERSDSSTGAKDKLKSKKSGKVKSVPQNARKPLSATKETKESERERQRGVTFRDRPQIQGQLHSNVKSSQTMTRRYNRNEQHTTASSNVRPTYGNRPPFRAC